MSESNESAPRRRRSVPLHELEGSDSNGDDDLESRTSVWESRRQDSRSLSFAAMDMSLDIAEEASTVQDRLQEVGGLVDSSITAALACPSREGMASTLQALQEALPQHLHQLKRHLADIPQFDPDVIHESSQLKKWNPQTVLLMCRKLATTNQSLSDSTQACQQLEHQVLRLEEALRKRDEQIGQIRRTIYRELVILKTTKHEHDAAEILSLFESGEGSGSRQARALQHAYEQDKEAAIRRASTQHKRAEQALEAEVSRLCTENRELQGVAAAAATRAIAPLSAEVAVQADLPPPDTAAAPSPPPTPDGSPNGKGRRPRRVVTLPRLSRNGSAGSCASRDTPSEPAALRSSNRDLQQQLVEARARTARLERQVHALDDERSRRQGLPRTVSLPSPDYARREKGGLARSTTAGRLRRTTSASRAPAPPHQPPPPARMQVPPEYALLEQPDPPPPPAGADEISLPTPSTPARDPPEAPPAPPSPTTAATGDAVAGALAAAINIARTGHATAAVSTSSTSTPPRRSGFPGAPPGGPALGIAVLLLPPPQGGDGSDTDALDVEGAAAEACRKGHGFLVAGFPSEGACTVVARDPRDAVFIAAAVLAAGHPLRAGVACGSAEPIVTPAGRVEYPCPAVQEVCRLAQLAGPSQLLCAGTVAGHAERTAAQRRLCIQPLADWQSADPLCCGARALTLPTTPPPTGAAAGDPAGPSSPPPPEPPSGLAPQQTLAVPHIAGPACVVWFLHAGGVGAGAGESPHPSSLLVLRSCCRAAGGVEVGASGGGEGGGAALASAFSSPPAAMACAARAMAALHEVAGEEEALPCGMWCAGLAEGVALFHMRRGVPEHYGTALWRAEAVARRAAPGAVLCRVEGIHTTLSYAQSLLPGASGLSGGVLQLRSLGDGATHLLSSTAYPTPRQGEMLHPEPHGLQALLGTPPLPVGRAVPPSATWVHAVAAFRLDSTLAPQAARVAWGIICLAAAEGGGCVVPDYASPGGLPQGLVVFETCDAACVWAATVSAAFLQARWGGASAHSISAYIASVPCAFPVAEGVLRADSRLLRHLLRLAPRKAFVVLEKPLGEPDCRHAKPGKSSVSLEPFTGAAWGLLEDTAPGCAFFSVLPVDEQRMMVVPSGSVYEELVLPPPVARALRAPSGILRHPGVCLGTLLGECGEPGEHTMHYVAVVHALAAKLGGNAEAVASGGGCSYVAALPSAQAAFAFAVKLLDICVHDAQREAVSRQAVDVVEASGVPGAAEQLDVGGRVLEHCPPNMILLTHAAHPAACSAQEVCSELTGAPIRAAVGGTPERCNLAAFALPPRKLTTGVTCAALGSHAPELSLPATIPHSSCSGWWRGLFWARPTPPIGGDTFIYASILGCETSCEMHTAAQAHSGCLVRTSGPHLGVVFTDVAALVTFLLGVNGASTWSVGASCVTGADPFGLQGPHDAPTFSGFMIFRADALASAASSGELLLHDMPESDVAAAVRTGVSRHEALSGTRVACPAGVVERTTLIRVSLFRSSSRSIPEAPALPLPHATAFPPEGTATFSCIAADTALLQIPPDDLQHCLALLRCAVLRCLRTHGQGGLCLWWRGGVCLLCTPNPAAAAAVCLSVQEGCLVDVAWPATLLDDTHGCTVLRSAHDPNTACDSILFRGLRIRTAVWTAPAAHFVMDTAGRTRCRESALSGMAMHTHAPPGVTLMDADAAELAEGFTWGSSLVLYTAPHPTAADVHCVVPALHRARPAECGTPAELISCGALGYTPRDPLADRPICIVAAVGAAANAFAAGLHAHSGTRVALHPRHGGVCGIAWFDTVGSAVAFADAMRRCGAGCGISRGPCATEHAFGGLRLYGLHVSHALRLAAAAPSGVVYCAEQLPGGSTHALAWVPLPDSGGVRATRRGSTATFVLTPHCKGCAPRTLDAVAELPPALADAANEAEGSASPAGPTLQGMALCFLEVLSPPLASRIARTVSTKEGFEIRRGANYILACCPAGAANSLLVDSVLLSRRAAAAAATTPLAKSIDLTNADQLSLTPSGGRAVVGPTACELALRVRESSHEKVFDLLWGCHSATPCPPLPWSAAAPCVVAVQAAPEEGGTSPPLSLFQAILREAALYGAAHCTSTPGGQGLAYALRSHSAGLEMCRTLHASTRPSGNAISCCVLESTSAFAEEIQTAGSLLPCCPWGSTVATSAVLQSAPAHFRGDRLTCRAAGITLHLVKADPSATPSEEYPSPLRWGFAPSFLQGATQGTPQGRGNAAPSLRHGVADSLDTRDILLAVDLPGAPVVPLLLDMHQSALEEAKSLFDCTELHLPEGDVGVASKYLRCFLASPAQARDMSLWLHLRYLVQPYPVEVVLPEGGEMKNGSPEESWFGWTPPSLGRGVLWRGPPLRIACTASHSAQLGMEDVPQVEDLLRKTPDGLTLVEGGSALLGTPGGGPIPKGLLPFQALLGGDVALQPVWTAHLEKPPQEHHTADTEPCSILLPKHLEGRVGHPSPGRPAGWSSAGEESRGEGGGGGGDEEGQSQQVESPRGMVEFLSCTFEAVKGVVGLAVEVAGLGRRGREREKERGAPTHSTGAERRARGILSSAARPGVVPAAQDRICHALISQDRPLASRETVHMQSLITDLLLYGLRKLVSTEGPPPPGGPATPVATPPPPRKTSGGDGVPARHPAPAPAGDTPEIPSGVSTSDHSQGRGLPALRDAGGMNKAIEELRGRLVSGGGGGASGGGVVHAPSTARSQTAGGCPRGVRQRALASPRPFTAGMSKLATPSVRYVRRAAQPEEEEVGGGGAEVAEGEEEEKGGDGGGAAVPLPQGVAGEGEAKALSPVPPRGPQVLDFRHHVEEVRRERHYQMFSPLSGTVQKALASPG